MAKRLTDEEVLAKVITYLSETKRYERSDGSFGGYRSASTARIVREIKVTKPRVEKAIKILQTAFQVRSNHGQRFQMYHRWATDKDKESLKKIYKAKLKSRRLIKLGESIGFSINHGRGYGTLMIDVNDLETLLNHYEDHNCR